MQEYIFNSPDAFCQEPGQYFTIIGKEVPPSEEVADRIDLLALDTQGNSVIIELKRGNDKLQLLQAVSYAAMISKWSGKQILESAGKDVAEKIAESMETQELDEINRAQRIVLIAEEYDYEVLVAAEWLYERDIEIDCVRVSLAEDGDVQYLTFAQVFPTPELAEQARARRLRGHVAGPLYSSWEDVLATVTNPAVGEFFKRYIEANHENQLRYRSLLFRAGGRRTFDALLRRDFALVDQRGRFPGDTDFWSKRSVQDLREVFDHHRLRFRLETAEALRLFEKAVNEDLRTINWGDTPSAQAATA